jgi:hypothetical protein
VIPLAKATNLSLWAHDERALHDKTGKRKARTTKWAVGANCGAPGGAALRPTHLWNLFLLKNGSCRAISTARLERIAALPPAAYRRGRLPRPFVLADWNVHLGAGFALRCFQRLSVPDIATRRCTWRHNRYTSGPSISVLSY